MVFLPSTWLQVDHYIGRIPDVGKTLRTKPRWANGASPSNVGRPRGVISGDNLGCGEFRYSALQRGKSSGPLGWTG